MSAPTLITASASESVRYALTASSHLKFTISHESSFYVKFITKVHYNIFQALARKIQNSENKNERSSLSHNSNRCHSIFFCLFVDVVFRK